MKLSSPKPNVVRSDTGFSVEVLGRVGMRYCEGGRMVLVDSEVLTTGKGIAISARSIRRWQPPNEAPISTEERVRIVENIKAVLRFWNQPIQILWDEGWEKIERWE